MADREDEQTITLPLVEERLHVDRRTVVTGRVRIRTEIEEYSARVEETLSRENVDVERVPVGRYVEAIPDVRQDGDVLVYPVVEEVIVKRLFLREEVRITCRRVSEPFESVVTLRRQNAVVERIPVGNQPLNPERSAQGDHMSDRTITAMYDTKDAAERAKDQLKAAGVSGVDIHNQDAGGSMTGAANEAGHATKGFFDKVANFFGGHEDTHAYAEGVRRGHFLLTAKVSESEADRAVQILDGSGAIDFDQAQTAWRGEGWTGGMSDDKVGREGYTAALDADTRGTAGVQPLSTGAQTQPQTTATAGYAERDLTNRTDDGTIQLVEERLAVGKREVERGGVRVRSYIVETPVQEQVNLREERVTLERHPVDRPVTNADALLQERNIELTETAEEAVVAKNAVVTEELTLRKDVTERTQEINDTVRRTEVEVEDVRPTEKLAGSTSTVQPTTTTPR